MRTILSMIRPCGSGWAASGRAVLALPALLGLLVLLTPDPASAQTRPAPVPYSAQGQTLEGAPWSSAQKRGKVLMVFYYSTSCTVCLQKMPELRANAAGWRGKPFELVLVSLDAKREDALAYALAVRQVEPSSVAFTTLWAGDGPFRDTLGAKPSRLPLTLVIDPQGQLRQRVEGRMAPEAWDDVAELLP